MTQAYDQLARPVQQWIRQQGWSELRPIQEKAITSTFSTEADLIIAASTAGGKTEAAFLPLISQVLDDPTDGECFDLLYIAPLKALITDQSRRLEEICGTTELTVVPWHGDISQSIKKRALKRPSGILLITPESLESLFVRRGSDIKRLFGTTRAAIIDEVHTMLDSERGIQLRSLMTRLEIARQKSIRKVGLSATLGDTLLAKQYLNMDQADQVILIEAKDAHSELLLQARGYLTGDTDNRDTSTLHEIATHLFHHFRGSDNLIFAGARGTIEVLADHLRLLCERERVPQEFYPHHASLSREHRQFVEDRLKSSNKPTTAVCTSTLELGIDIGKVKSVAQIGAPFTVAALRQRLGRSGRRQNEPAILRQYVIEAKLHADSSIIDRLRLGLIRAIAMIELLLERWNEPPKTQALHLSTLVHQVLSVIAQTGGISAEGLFAVLCQRGPFRQVTSEIFIDTLRAISRPDVGLIEQNSQGQLLLGAKGEQLVEHYSFYAVFKTPEEYRLECAGQDLGTIPIDNILTPNMLLIFSGRRWLIQQIYEESRVIVVTPNSGGKPPMFGGALGETHDTVIAKMFELFEDQTVPHYLDHNAQKMLAEGRLHYRQLNLATKSLHHLGHHSFLITTRVGSIKTITLAIALKQFGFKVDVHDGCLTVMGSDESPLKQLFKFRQLSCLNTHRTTGPQLAPHALINHFFRRAGCKGSLRELSLWYRRSGHETT